MSTQSTALRFLLEQQAEKQLLDTSADDKTKSAELLQTLFPAQRNFVLDPARKKAALCPRRSGKSYAMLVYALALSLRKPGARVLVLARVRRQAKGVYWDTLKTLCETYEVPAHYRNVALECEFLNGSKILFAGADTADEVDKYRGQQFDLCIIDECKSYTPEILDELVEEVLQPTLLDRDGTLCMIGTPGAVPVGLFWAITTQQPRYKPARKEDPVKLRIIRFDDYPYERNRWPKHHWALHKWTTKDNTSMPQIWERALLEHVESGIPDDDPVWQREYLGRWVSDKDSLVYAYLAAGDKVHWVRDPEGEFGLPKEDEWRYILGMDIGFVDDTAFVVAAWSETNQALHFIHTEKFPKLTVEQIAKKVRALENRFNGFDAKVADTGGLGKTIIESLGDTYGLHFEAARKTDKCDHIKLLNSDMVHGRIRVDKFDPLVTEWKTAQWATPEKKAVDRDCDDHASDAALYTWRFAYHHWSKDRERELVPGSREWWKAKEKAEVARLVDERNKSKDHMSRYRQSMDQLPSDPWILKKYSS